MIGERPVEADVERLAPGGRRVAQHRERELRLPEPAVPTTRRRNGSNAKRRAHSARPPDRRVTISPPRPVSALSDGEKCGRELQLVEEELAQSPGQARARGFVGRQRLTDELAQRIAPCRIDDALRRQAGVPRRLTV